MGKFDPNNSTLPSYFQDSLKSFNELAIIGDGLEPKKQLLGDFIHENSVCHFPSERGTGKTLFGLQHCISIAMQQKSFCKEQIQLHGNSLFINCELGEPDLARRISCLVKNASFDYKNIYSPYQPYTLTTRKSLLSIKDKVVEIITEKKPVVVWIDNLTIAFQYEGSDRKRITDFMIELLNLKDELGFSLVLIDHMKKGSSWQLTDSDLQSGSGAKTDLSDQDMFLRKSTSGISDRLMVRRKSRNAPEMPFGKAKLLHLDPETLWFKCYQDEVNEADYINISQFKSEAPIDKASRDELVLLLHEKGITVREIEKLTGISKSAAGRIIKQAGQ